VVNRTEVDVRCWRIEVGHGRIRRRLSERQESCRIVAGEGVESRHILQARRRSAGLDDEVVVISSSCYEPVAGRYVANPFDIADTKRQLEAEEKLVVDKCVDGEVGSVATYRRRVVVDGNRRALRDRQGE
jgi:hypothetical protein